MTISISKIKVDYNEAKKMLKKLDIRYTEEKSKSNSLRKSDFSKEFIRQSYKNDYRETYKVARKFSDYNLLIEDDGALLQFGYDLDEYNKINELRYAYYEAPTEHISYEKFLEKSGFEYEECGSLFYDEYTQYISEEALKNNVTSVRYDFSLKQRKELIHPVSHIHIGQQNEIRLPISFIMTPKNFLSFIIRHIYWERWRIAINEPRIREEYLSSYTTGVTLENYLFTKDEKKDLYLKYN